MNLKICFLTIENKQAQVANKWEKEHGNAILTQIRHFDFETWSKQHLRKLPPGFKKNSQLSKCHTVYLFQKLKSQCNFKHQIMYTCFQLIRLYLKVDKEVIQFDLAEAMTKVLATSLQKSADQTNTEQMIWRIKGRRVLNIQTNSKSNQGIQHLELMYKIKSEPYFGCC